MKTWQKWIVGITVVLLVLMAGGYYVKNVMMKRASFWESTIAGFEASDKRDMPKPGGIVFIGSSSIAYWKTLKRDMAPLPVIGRGFGGSQLDHATHYAPRILYPYKPKIIVLYSGENDLAWGQSSDEVLGELKTFIANTKQQLPRAKILYLSVKPSRLRSGQWPIFKAFNERAKALCKTYPHVTYVDVASSILGADKKADKTLFLWDRLHLNKKGYQRWTRILKPLLQKAFASATNNRPTPQKQQKTKTNAPALRR